MNGVRIACCSVLALIAAGTADPAAAQQASPSGSLLLEEIVVTARRREEDPQSVPVTITAFSGAAIHDQVIQTSQDLSRLTPAFTVRPSQNREQSSQARLRGLPGVRTYFAEVPYGIAGQNPLFDLENVQVLVGPQGTLFGLNATGGAILREPKRPSENFEGFVELGLGNYQQRQVTAAVNVPLVDDKVMVRVAVDRQTRGGFSKVLNSDQRLDDTNYWSYRAGVTLRPADWIENYLVADAYRSTNNGAAFFLRAVNPTGALARIFGAANTQSLLAQQQALGPRTMLGTNIQDSWAITHSAVLVDILKITLSEQLTVKNIASIATSRSASVFDQDGVALAALEYYNPNRELSPASVPKTEEAQLLGSFFDNRLNAVVGGFLSYTDVPHAREQCNGNISFGALPACSTNDGKSRTQAVFAQATYNVGHMIDSLDGLNVTAGYRYNWDYSSQWSRTVNRTTRACTSATADRDCVSARNGRWTAPSWTFSVDYHFAEDVMAYATYARGYSTGGFNGVTLPEQFRTFAPEYNTDLEFGVKADWRLGDTTLRTNASAFRYWYDNVQSAVGVLFNEGGVLRASSFTQNAAEVKLEGIELQAAAVHAPIELKLHYQYLMAKYTKFPSVDLVTLQSLDLSTRAIPYISKHRLILNGRYVLPIDANLGEASIGFTYAWQSTFNAATDGVPTGVEPAKGQIDFRADWKEVGGYPIDIGAFVLNANDVVYPVGTGSGYASQGYYVVLWNQPRTYGLQIRYRFGS